MKRHTRIRSRAALTLTAAASLAVGLGLGASAAVTHSPGASASNALTDTAFVSAANGSSVGTVTLDDLLSPRQFSDALGVRTVTSTMGPHQHAGVSACTGEQRMSSLLPRKARVFTGYYHGRAHGNRIETEEAIADHAGLTAYRKVVRELRGCQHEPAGHWHYGALHRDNSTSGRAMWMATYDGNGDRDGGVVAALSHHHLAVAEVGGGSKAGLEMIANDVSLRLR